VLAPSGLDLPIDADWVSDGSYDPVWYILAESPGDYVVEMYLDGKLLKTTPFTMPS
jgi:hypothetical protein